MRKGISPVVAIVLLISIAVVGAVALYFFVGGIATAQPATTKPAPLNIVPLGGDGEILVANLGGEPFDTSTLFTTEEDVLIECLSSTILPNTQSQCTLVGHPVDRTVIVYGPSGGSAVVNPLASGFRTPQCTDGLLHPNPPDSEECDDGNMVDTDNCTSYCNNATCGDSFVWAGYEECDDGGTANGDGCNATCFNEVCGNGYVDPVAETCDDGDADNSDSCPDGVGGTCAAATCGDGHVWNTDGGSEECEDGNTCNGDGCYGCVVEDWVNTYGGAGTDRFYTVVDASGGNITAAGTNYGSEYDYWLLAVNSTGDGTRDEKAHDVGNTDTVHGLVLATDGHYVLTGSRGGPDTYTIKYNSSDFNDILWTDAYDHSSTTDRGYAITEVDSGDFIVAGYKGTGATPIDFLVRRIDGSTGNGEWTKTFDYNSGHDRAWGITNASDGTVVVVGSANNPDSEVWVIKIFSNNGTQVAGWGGVFDYAGGDDAALSVIENSAGDFLVAGIADNNADDDMWVIKLSSTGHHQWNYTSDSGNGDDAAREIIETTGGYVIAGKYDNGADLDAWIMKIDASGGHVWNYTYGCTGDDEANAITEMSTGGFAVAGYKTDATVDGWILRLDANGQL